MASTDVILSDPLNRLRDSIATNNPPIPTSSAESTLASDIDIGLAVATHLFFPTPRPQSFSLDTSTRFTSSGKPVDLRSIYFAWLKKDVAIPDYIASAQRLSEELSAAGKGGKVQNLVFVERLDLITWLEGASEESEYIQPLATDSATAQASRQALDTSGAAGGVAPAAAPGVGRGGKAVNPRLAVIYSGERKMGDRNCILRGIKPTDFSHVRKTAESFLGRSRNKQGQHASSTVNPLNSNPSLVSLPKKRGGRPDPIILLSPSASSLLRMSNIKSFLESGIYVPPDSALAGSSNTASILHISRMLPSIDASRPLRFILVDTPEQFKPDYWSRVVGVFTTGQTWQFKSYKWQSPSDLFRNALGIFVGWRGEDVPSSVKGWGRGVMSTAVEKWNNHSGVQGRWRDREVVEGIWGNIEESMKSRGWGKDGGSAMRSSLCSEGSTAKRQTTDEHKPKTQTSHPPPRFQCLHSMPELANPRKRGRPPKNTVVLGETVKRQRIYEDITTQGDRGHFARSSQGNHRVVADPEDDLESLHSSLPRKANGRSSHGRQSRMSRQSDDELDDTIIVTPERQRGRPQGQKTTKEGRSSRNEHSENGSRAVDLPNPRRGSTGSPPHRGRMRLIDASEVPETPTKRGRGRPRKSQITTGDMAHIHGNSENWGISAQRADTVQPQSLRSSVLSDLEKHPTPDLLGETKTKRKRGRPRKGLAKQSERSLSLAVDDEIAEPPVEDPARIQQVEVLKTIVLEKLTGKRDVRLVGLDDERGKVHQLIEQTVVSGEGNSMLLIGARGSGKSTLVERIISEISSEHKEDFHTVRLNGFIHTDDKLALREIWRQLGIEMEVEDDLMGKTSNYADILSSLLALLSHPSELSENSLNHTAKSVIFVLSEFDLFTSHPRQTLLYNLFDIAQGRKAPILVLGLTTRIDVVESLEKRVKSRFSHRHVHLSLPKSLGAFWEICKQALLVSVDDIQTAEQKEALMTERGSRVLEAWNSVIEALGSNTDFKRLLQSIFYTTKGVKDFHVACLLPVINLSPQNPNLKGRDFTENNLVPPESKLHILDGLSDLELSLLIAAARLDIILDTDTCNFNMAYDEYTTLASRVKLQSSASGAAAVGAGSKIWGREVGLGAWERLAEYSLIIPAIGGPAGAISGNGTRDVGRMGRMFRVDVGLEEIWQSMPNLGAVMAKWCREI